MRPLVGIALGLVAVGALALAASSSSSSSSSKPAPTPPPRPPIPLPGGRGWRRAPPDPEQCDGCFALPPGRVRLSAKYANPKDAGAPSDDVIATMYIQDFGDDVDAVSGFVLYPPGSKLPDDWPTDDPNGADAIRGEALVGDTPIGLDAPTVTAWTLAPAGAEARALAGTKPKLWAVYGQTIEYDSTDAGNTCRMGPVFGPLGALTTTRPAAVAAVMRALNGGLDPLPARVKLCNEVAQGGEGSWRVFYFLGNPP